MDEFKLLGSVREPRDLRAIPKQRLSELAAEIRRAIIQAVSSNGGHLASNLGVVELTLALHLEFESPRDKLVWDVGHQCYVHKLLTGRFERFSTIRQAGGLSGFPKKCESEHDVFGTGHASTSISAALGLLEGMRARGEPGKVVAVIGDGALTGGLALEGLNHAGHLKRDLIIVLNDNTMSISPNVGAISYYLSRLAATELYQQARRRFDSTVPRIPLFGRLLFNLAHRVERGIKGLVLKETLFSDLGFEYIGPVDGHDLDKLREVLRTARNLSGPVVVHVMSRKGKGYAYAEDNPSIFHGVAPFNIVDGKFEKKDPTSFTDLFSAGMLEAAGRDERVVAITAAMSKGTGLGPMQEKFPRRVYDVGITEAHAVTFAAGLAAAGLKPVVAVYSTFMQRSVDQVIHDVALQNLPVVFALDRAGLVADDGETHQGLYDIGLFRNVPGLALLAPSTRGELGLMLDWALRQAGPVMLRYPKSDAPEDQAEGCPALAVGRGAFFGRPGGQAEALIVVAGGLLEEARKARETLAAAGTAADIYLLRFLKPFDAGYFLRVASPYRALVLVEDGARSGGVGEQLAALLSAEGSGRRFEYLGAPDRFLAQASRDELVAACGLDARSIAKAVAGCLNRKGALKLVSAG